MSPASHQGKRAPALPAIEIDASSCPQTDFSSSSSSSSPRSPHSHPLRCIASASIRPYERALVGLHFSGIVLFVLTVWLALRTDVEGRRIISLVRRPDWSHWPSLIALPSRPLVEVLVILDVLHPLSDCPILHILYTLCPLPDIDRHALPIGHALRQAGVWACLHLRPLLCPGPLPLPARRCRREHRQEDALSGPARHRTRGLSACHIHHSSKWQPARAALGQAC